MPSLVNNKTGLMEDLSQDDANAALSSGTHGVAVINPQGKPEVASSLQDARTLLGQGYSQPSDQQVNNLAEYGKWNSPREAAKGNLEELARSVIPGVSGPIVTEAEKALGVPEENIANRMQYQRGTLGHTIAGGAGIAAGSVLGGLTNTLGATSGAIESLLGSALGKSAIAKIGTNAVSMAAQSELLNANTDVSRWLVNDPSLTAESAVADAKAAFLFGGAAGAAIGTIPALWGASKGPQVVKQYLQNIKNKVTPEGDSIPGLLDAAGMSDIPASSKAGMSANQTLRDAHTSMVARAESAGYFAKKTIADDALTMDAAKEKLGNVIGVQPEDFTKYGRGSQAQAGAAAKDEISKQISAEYAPIKKGYAAVDQKMADVVLSPEDQANLTGVLTKIRQPFAAIPKNSDEYKLLSNYIEEVPNLRTWQDWDVFRKSLLGKVFGDDGMPNISGGVFKGLNDFEDGVVDKTMAQSAMAESGGNLDAAAQAKAEIDSVRSSYSALKDKIYDINTKLRVPKWWEGPQTFLDNLNDDLKVPAEKVINRLTPVNDAAALGMLQQQFPGVAKISKDYFLQDMVGGSLGKASNQFSPMDFVKQFNTMKPELKNFLFDQGSQEKITAIGKALSALSDRYSPSGPLILNQIFKWAPTVAGLAGHVVAPGAGGPIGYVAGFLGRELPDAISYASLKYMGSHGEINPEAFYSMARYIGGAIRTSKILNTGIQAAVEGSQDPIKGAMPDPKSDAKLESTVINNYRSPQQLMGVGGNIGYYLPDHAAKLGAVATRAAQFLNEIKPQTSPIGTLDSNHIPSPTAHKEYSRALSLVNNPLGILETIRKGNLNEKDMAVMERVYPAMLNHIRAQVVNHIVEKKAAGEMIPYQRRLVLSQFLGQNLDSTIGPGPVLAGMFPKAAQPSQHMGQGKPGGKRGGSSQSALSKLKGMPGLENTMTQKAEQDRITDA